MLQFSLINSTPVLHAGCSVLPPTSPVLPPTSPVESLVRADKLKVPLELNRIAPRKQCAKRDVEDNQVKQLQRFARRGGPDLRSIRRYPEQGTQAKMSSKRSRSSRSSAPSSNKKPTTLSSKDAAFEQELIDNGVYPPGYDDVEPENLEEIVEKLGQPRASLSPSLFSRDEFLHFRRKNDEATTEAEIMSQVFPMITGKTNIPSGYDQLFNNLKPLGDHISNPKTDYFNGSRTAEIRPKVQNDLEQYIIPSSQRHRPALPNFFMEAKGPDGKASEAKRQTTQDLAAGARGMLRMQSYGLDDPVFDNKAHTFGSTYHSGYMQLYAMHPTEPGDADGKPEYHTTKVRGFDLTDNLDIHRQGIGAFRNLRDLAKERRAEFIASANETADSDDEPEVASVDTYLTSFISTSQSTQSELFTVDSDHEESDSTSADELVIPALPKKRTKARQLGNKKHKSKIGDIPVDEDDE
ncbi:glyoxylate reductase protein [Rutstroemia sp. NJR-2017a WRK4]|nr:glyoxylate reductase protein [Rutstroemia sp. NJR-2017a WRK4]